MIPRVANSKHPQTVRQTDRDLSEGRTRQKISSETLGNFPQSKDDHNIQTPAPNKIFPAPTTSPSDNNKAIPAVPSSLHLRGQQHLSFIPETNINWCRCLLCCLILHSASSSPPVSRHRPPLLNFLHRSVVAVPASFLHTRRRPINRRCFLPSLTPVNRPLSFRLNPTFIAGNQSSPHSKRCLSFLSRNAVFCRIEEEDHDDDHTEGRGGETPCIGRRGTANVGGFPSPNRGST